MTHPNDEQIDTLLREIGEVDVPEPSPLFWEQFGARVNAAIDAPERPRRWLPFGAIGWMTAAAVLCVAIAAAYLTRSSAVYELPDAVAAPAASVTDALDGSDAADIDTDEAWALVRTFAAEVHYDDAHAAGVVPVAGSIDRAATEMSDEERAELVRLIEDELKRTGA